MSFFQGAYSTFTDAATSVQSLIHDPINWELGTSEEEETDYDHFQEYTEYDPFTGEATDYYGGVLPESMSKAQTSFSLAQLWERGAKGPLDIVKAVSNLVSNQSKFHDKDFSHRRPKANNLFFRFEQWALPGEDSSLYWLTEYFTAITEKFNAYDERWRRLLHGDDSPIKKIFPNMWRTGLTEDEEESLQLWSSGLECFQSLGKAGTYKMSADKNLQSLRAGQQELDEFQRKNLRSKNIWQLIYNIGLGSDKLALILAFPFAYCDHWMEAAYLVWYGRLCAEMAYMGGMLAAGGMNRDAIHTRDLKELRSAVQIVLDESNRAEMKVREVALNHYGSEHHRLLTPLRASWIAYFGDRFSLFEKRSNPIRRRLAQWFLGKLPGHKKIPGIKNLFEKPDPTSDLVQTRAVIDKANELMAEEDMSATGAVEALLESLAQAVPDEVETPYQKALENTIKEQGAFFQEQTESGEGEWRREKALEEQALEESSKLRQEILDRAQRLVGVYEEEDPDTGLVKPTLGLLHRKTIQISELKAPDQRTILELMWDMVPVGASKTCKCVGMSKKDRMAKVAQLDVEIQEELANFREFSAERILKIREISEGIGEETTQTIETVENLAEKMKPKRDASNLQVAQVGAANSRLFDSIPKFAQTAFFLVIGAQVLADPTIADHEVMATIKGALKLPWYLWGSVALVSATGAGLTFKRAWGEYQRAKAQNHAKNKWYNRIALFGEAIKMPGNILVADPVTKPVGVVIYAGGCMVEAVCHTWDNWDVIKGSIQYLFASEAQNGNGNSNGQGQQQDQDQEGA